MTAFVYRHLRDAPLAVFAVEEIADGAAARGVDFVLGAALGVVGRAARRWLGFSLGLAAGGTAISEAGLAWAKLEFVAADNTGFDREGHAHPW